MSSFSHCSTSDISLTDGCKSAATILGVTFALTTLGVTLDKTLGDHVAIQALILSSWMIAMVVAAPFTYLKPYSKTAQYVMIGAAVPGFYIFFLVTLLIGSAI